MASLLLLGVSLFPGGRGCRRSGQHIEPVRKLGRGALGAAADLSVPFLVSDSCRKSCPRASRRARFRRDFCGLRARLTVWFLKSRRVWLHFSLVICTGYPCLSNSLWQGLLFVFQ